jgi:hypothetical protein
MLFAIPTAIDYMLQSDTHEACCFIAVRRIFDHGSVILSVSTLYTP